MKAAPLKTGASKAQLHLPDTDAVKCPRCNADTAPQAKCWKCHLFVKAPPVYRLLEGAPRWSGVDGSWS